MADPVDDLTLAQLVARMGQMIDEQTAAVRMVMVQRLNGAGPIMLTHADHGGKELLIWNGGATGAIVAHLPQDAAVGTIHILRRYGVAPVKLVVDGAAILRCARAGHNGPASQYVAVTVRCIGNADGATAEWVLDGETMVVA